MSTEIIEAVIKHVLATAGDAVPKTTIIKIVEETIGRPLTEVEKGLGVWRARESFMGDTKVELMSKNGSLSRASAAQSISRRRGERSRALRTLERSAQRAAQLVENDSLSDEQRKLLEAAADKANTMLIHATASLHRKSLPKPPGI